MFKRQEFERLFGSSELNADNLSEKDLKKLGITKYEFEEGDKKIVYYLFYGTSKMLDHLPYAS